MVTRDEAKQAIETVVRYVESIEGPLREGLEQTPERVVKSYEERYTQDIQRTLVKFWIQHSIVRTTMA